MVPYSIGNQSESRECEAHHLFGALIAQSESAIMIAAPAMLRSGSKDQPDVKTSKQIEAIHLTEQAAGRSPRKGSFEMSNAVEA